MCLGSVLPGVTWRPLCKKVDLGPAHATSGEECSRQRKGIMEHLLWKDASSRSDKEAMPHCLVLCVLGEGVQRERELSTGLDGCSVTLTESSHSNQDTL